jgi:hypothetical protein
MGDNSNVACDADDEDEDDGDDGDDEDDCNSEDPVRASRN